MHLKEKHIGLHLVGALDQYYENASQPPYRYIGNPSQLTVFCIKILSSVTLIPYRYSVYLYLMDSVSLQRRLPYSITVRGRGVLHKP